MSWVVLALALLVQATADPLAEGLKALDEQRYGAAAEAFEKALSADPENYGARFNLAFALTMLGRRGEAVMAYEKVLSRKPGLYQAQLNLGLLFLEAKEPVRAVPLLTGAAEQKPSEFRPHYYLAEALYATGDDAGAERHYRRASEIDPSHPGTHIGLGRAVFNQGRYGEAEPLYRRAAELNPEYRELLIELGARYEEKDQTEPAIAIYREFLDRPEVSERLGHLLLRSGKVEEAVPHLQEAVRRSPTVANRYALATAYLKAKKPEEALPLLDLALADEPENYDLLMVRGRLLRDRREFVPAAETFLRAVRVRPEAKEAWSELAGMLILAENYPHALAALDKLEALGDPPPSIHFFRAMIWDKARQYQNALPGYQKFLELSRDRYPDEEFKARQRIKVIQKELER